MLCLPGEDEPRNPDPESRLGGGETSDAASEADGGSQPRVYLPTAFTRGRQRSLSLHLTLTLTLTLTLMRGHEILGMKSTAAAVRRDPTTWLKQYPKRSLHTRKLLPGTKLGMTQNDHEPVTPRAIALPI